ncbi:MAG: 3-dehydroquinate synthase [Alphaproteobacteria bacterium]
MNVLDVVQVGLPGKNYDITIGRGLLQEVGAAISTQTRAQKCAIVTDEIVAPHYLERVNESCAAAGIEAAPVVIPATESTKSFQQLERVIDALLESEIERNDVVIALGGGVVGDLAGFAASILRRGVGVVQIPTTLLSQVDSSVGGKTGINTRQGKNLVGSFHQPAMVTIDLDTLDSLPDRQIRAGYAEVVKYGLIADADFFGWLESNGKAVLERETKATQHAVSVSCRAKAAIVERDERETSGARALLNLGHTFGHAIEAEAGYDGRVLHGEAVAVGMMMALNLSKTLGFEEVDRVGTHLSSLGLPTSLKDLGLKATAESLYAHMAQDKKVEAGQITFVLCRAIGAAHLERQIPPDAALDALRACDAS